MWYEAGVTRQWWIIFDNIQLHNVTRDQGDLEGLEAHIERHAKFGYGPRYFSITSMQQLLGA
jgi:hypothetical protein